MDNVEFFAKIMSIKAEIYDMIIEADAMKNKRLLKKTKKRIDLLGDMITDLYDLYNYELTKIQQTTQTGEPSREPRFFYVRRFEIDISIYRGQPRFDSIITGKAHEGSVTAYGREVPDAPVEITVAEFAETIVMHKEMSAPEVRRDDFQSGEIQRI